MNDVTPHNSKRRTDRAAKRRAPQWRRLAIEQVESRLLLAADGFADLDADTYNIETMGPGYAVISYVDTAANTGSAPLVAGVPNSSTGVSLNFDFSQVVNNRAVRDSLQVLAGNSNSVAIDSIYAFRPTDFGAPNAPGDVRAPLLFSIDLEPVRLHGALPNHWLESSFTTIVAAKTAPIDNSDTGVSVDIPTMPVQPINRSPTLTVPSGVVAATNTVAPANSAAPANSLVTIGYSDSQVNVGQVVDELLISGVEIVDQAMPGGTGAANFEFGSTDDGQLFAGTVPQTGNGLQSSGAPQTDSLYTVPVAGAGELLASGESTGEGGMIPIQGIVGQLSSEAMVAAAGQQIAAREAAAEITANDAAAEISGELARVTVMELIAGEAEPAAPPSATDQTLIVAADDDARFTTTVAALQDLEPAAAFTAFRAMASQAGLATSLVAPVHPGYIASMASALGSALSDAFATGATLPAPIAQRADASLEDARSAAFAEWDDAPAGAVADEETGSLSYGLLPLVGILAGERIIAAKHKRKRDAAASPALP